jgi:hypothetical protein
MKKSSKLLVIFVLLGFLLILGIKSYAEWINCSAPFPGTCTQGGCRDPQRAEDCWLNACNNDSAINVHCDPLKN